MLAKITIAGAGGQGVMLLGKILAEASLREGRHVTWFPSYGAEVRGGAAYCMVIISDEEISSPYIERTDVLIAMNNPSLERLGNRVKKNGMVIANSSLVKKRLPLHLFFAYPFTDIAARCGNVKVANMVALGAMLSHKRIVKTESIFEIIDAFAHLTKKELVLMNKQAFSEGLRLVSRPSISRPGKRGRR